MRKFLGTLVILVLIVAGVGFYRGWFGISGDDQPGETNVELTIDKGKIKQDAEAASQKARELKDRLKDGTTGDDLDEGEDSAGVESAPGPQPQ